MPGRDFSPHERRPVTRRNDRIAAETALAAIFAVALAGSWSSGVGAQTMDAALARAYNGNPTLNAQRASVRATNENVPQALSGYRPRITASADIGASILDANIPGARAIDLAACSARCRRADRPEHLRQRQDPQLGQPGRIAGARGAGHLAQHRAERAARCGDVLYERAARHCDPEPQPQQCRSARGAAAPDAGPISSR